jgi:signal transduction histidine kinase
VPRRLLQEPHILAHELRTPLSLLAGWYSMMESGDVHPDRTPQAWSRAMTAIQTATARLNILISEACDESEALKRLETSNYLELVEMTSSAIEHARRVHRQVTGSLRRQRAK